MILPFARARERGYAFETGRPVSFPFIRNTEKAPYLAGRFQQDIEPAGRYLLLDEDPNRPLVRGWVRGDVSFDAPLVLRWGEAYDETSWKYAIAEHYRTTGRALSRRILKDGFDAIVTVGDDGLTREIVDLRPAALPRRRNRGDR